MSSSLTEDDNEQEANVQRISVLQLLAQIKCCSCENYKHQLINMLNLGSAAPSLHIYEPNLSLQSPTSFKRKILQQK